MTAGSGQGQLVEMTIQFMEDGIQLINYFYAFAKQEEFKEGEVIHHICKIRRCVNPDHWIKYKSNAKHLTTNHK
jgi:hypothetical protein